MENNYEKYATGIDDEELTWEATGLLGFLTKCEKDVFKLYKSLTPEFLESCKIDDLKTCRSALKELREHNYCHYFEVKEKERLIETYHLISERPVIYSENLYKQVLTAINLDNKYELIFKEN